jgi:light-regulated signal transduction histidine kinase (bacteriophytochrome)
LLFSQHLVASDVKTTFDIQLRRKDSSVFYMQIASNVFEYAKKPNRQFFLSILDFTDRRNAEEALAAEVVRKEELAQALAAEVVRKEELAQALAAEAERKEELSQALERSNEDLEQFAYVASHDLQEPLRAVNGFANILTRHLGDALDDEGREYVGRIVDGATRMSALISGLLQYSRIGSKAKAFRSTVVKDALDKALSNLSEAIKESGAQVIVSELPSVVMDPLQLELLFQNLIGNAIKFRVKGSSLKITVCATHRDEEWLFSICDNGIGLDPKFADRIFTIFQRLHTQSTYPGTGIGLALCKKIVERNGGKIWVESKPGEGATFFFTVPDVVQTPNE